MDFWYQLKTNRPFSIFIFMSKKFNESSPISKVNWRQEWTELKYSSKESISWDGTIAHRSSTYTDNEMESLRMSQQMRMDWNELKWIQIFRNIDSRMLKLMLFNPECIFNHL